MKISVCIPAYNRVELLPALLDSIVRQDYRDFEILVCEDNSPQREQIREAVHGYTLRYPDLIRYWENETNLGYDGNLRNLVARANGSYCFFMGNDDLMCPKALSTVASALDRYDNVGVVMRSYATFDGSPERISEVFRYFDSERFFPAGPPTIATFFRRCVVIPGLVLHRAEALRHSTDRFDGTLLYQLHLVGSILTTMNGLFLPEILVLYRSGGIPDFGSSESEKGKFVPTQQTPESSVHFMRGMLEIAQHVERTHNVPVYDQILRDIGNYSYPVLSIQSKQPLPVYLRYCCRLAKLGFWKNPMFYLYFVAILVFGSRRMGKIIQTIKRRLGHTPGIGGIYAGDSP